VRRKSVGTTNSSEDSESRPPNSKWKSANPVAGCLHLLQTIFFSPPWEKKTNARPPFPLQPFLIKKNFLKKLFKKKKTLFPIPFGDGPLSGSPENGRTMGPKRNLAFFFLFFFCFFFFFFPLFFSLFFFFFFFFFFGRGGIFFFFHVARPGVLFSPKIRSFKPPLSAAPWGFVGLLCPVVACDPGSPRGTFPHMFDFNIMAEFGNLGAFAQPCPQQCTGPGRPSSAPEGFCLSPNAPAATQTSPLFETFSPPSKAQALGFGCFLFFFLCSFAFLVLFPFCVFCPFFFFSPFFFFLLFF